MRTKVYTFSAIRDHNIPKSLKCSNSATKLTKPKFPHNLSVADDRRSQAHIHVAQIAADALRVHDAEVAKLFLRIPKM